MQCTECLPLPAQVLDLIRAQSAQNLPPGIIALADAARNLHGESVRAVLLYGSTMRTGNVHDGLADLYLLVDDYRSAFNSRTLAFFNKLLPPNVFYLEVPYQGHVLRAKYAVFTLADFRKGAARWFHSYLWGRFSQKSLLIYANDKQVADQVRETLAIAVMTFVMRTLPQMQTAFTARDLWSRGLSLSYRSELRTEQPAATSRLYDTEPHYYQALTSAILGTIPAVRKIETDCPGPCYQYTVSRKARRVNDVAWRLRILQGKGLSILRLLKGAVTFKGGVDYILWKIERHSGIRVEVGPKLKRVPPLALLVVLWRLYRKDAFR